MKVLRLCGAAVAVAVAGALPAAPAAAEDQAIQSILLRLRCTPSKVVRTELAAGVTSYEVTCKGHADVVYIVCQKAECRQQTKRLNDVERETPL
jgi:hypothetical protein